MDSRGLGDGLDNDLGGSVPDGGFGLDRKSGRESSAESRGDSEGLEELGSHFDGGFLFFIYLIYVIFLVRRGTDSQRVSC